MPLSAPKLPAPAGFRPRAPRAPLLHVVKCQFAGHEDYVEVTTLNVSQSGMLIRSPLVPSLGTTLKFKFFLETGLEIISGTGTATRVGRDADGADTVGIAFAEIEPAKQRILARVIELNSVPDNDSD